MEIAQKVTHVIDRLSFGAGPGDRAHVESIGPAAYIQTQLSPETLAEPNELTDQLNQIATLQLTPLALFKQFSAPPNASSEQRQAAGRRRRRLSQDATRSRLLMAVTSPRQLQEVMVDFWFNHFNVFEGKNLTRLWVGAYENAAIRPHALGKFKDLLSATAHHPAMLFYLDNWRNTDPDSEAAKGPFRGLNENYARELMELHTLGVDGGYTQTDVETLARIFTGWSTVHPQQPDTDESGFIFAANRHDSSNEVLLGQAIAGTGKAEGEQALELLAQHPSTAWHISYKLAQHFVADSPPEALVSQLSARFTATDGDIKAVLQTLFESNAFWNEAHFQRKFRTPYQYVLAQMRSLGIGSSGPAVTEETIKRFTGALDQLGMPLYRCRTPNGYAQTEAYWLNPDAMMRRVSLAVATVNQQKPKPEPAALLETLKGQLSAETTDIVSRVPAPQQTAVILGSPEMMYR